MQNSVAMKIFFSTLLTTVALGVLVVGCAQKKAAPLAQSASPKAAAAPVVSVPATNADEAPADAKEKRPRFGDSVVYIDGKCVGVIRATELPLNIKARHIKLAGDYETTRYGFLDYARALGVDVKRIKALHLYGGSRVVVVDKAEVARIGDGITFSFVQGDRGKPRIHWPAVKLRVNSTIDMVSNVAFYLEKEPPVLKDNVLTMPDGTVVEGKVPYAPEEQGSGTRVYIDGTLVGTVKRKKLTPAMLATPDKAAAKTDGTSETKSDAKADEDRFSLLSFATSLRADAKLAKSVDLVAGDDVVARMTPEGARSLTFNVPPRNRGQAVVDLASEDGASRRARITAVQIYVSSTPPSRAIVKLDEAPEAAPKSGQGGSGSDDDL